MPYFLQLVSFSELFLHLRLAFYGWLIRYSARTRLRLATRFPFYFSSRLSFEFKFELIRSVRCYTGFQKYRSQSRFALCIVSLFPDSNFRSRSPPLSVISSQHFSRNSIMLRWLAFLARSISVHRYRQRTRSLLFPKIFR